MRAINPTSKARLSSANDKAVVVLALLAVMLCSGAIRMPQAAANAAAMTHTMLDVCLTLMP
jgi:hypothetical protein